MRILIVVICLVLSGCYCVHNKCDDMTDVRDTTKNEYGEHKDWKTGGYIR